MSEFNERLWPDESEQPKWEFIHDGETYILGWSNTWIQFYRTGIEEYDERLQLYDHVVHKYQEYDDGHSDYVILSFSEIGSDGLQYLIDNSYPRHIDPMPEDYILKHVEQLQAESTIPDAIGPDFGAEAA